MPEALGAIHRPYSVALTIGNELLSGYTQDTNTHWLAQRLSALGYPLRRVHLVGDDEPEIVRWLRLELEDDPIFIFCCGGLGPTPDDRTLKAVATALDLTLELDRSAADHIQLGLDWLHSIGRIESPEMTEANRRMAEIPAGATVLNNSMGMAPGLMIEVGRGAAPVDITAVETGEPRRIFVLPGIPRELKTIFDEEIAPQYLAGGSIHATEEVHFTGAVEAQFWELLNKIEREFPGVVVGSYPQPDRGHLVIRLSGPDPELVHLAVAMVRAEAPGLARERRPTPG